MMNAKRKMVSVTDHPHRQFLGVALPMVLAALASPLPGIVDTAMLGHLSDVHYLSAVAAGSTVIGLVIWSFSFLRMGVTATTARALGGNNLPLQRLLLAQSLLLASFFGLSIIVLQGPLLSLAFSFITPPEPSLTLAGTYTRIRILGAPAILGLFCISGWLIGTQQAKIALALMLLVNALNIGLDFVFIVSLDMNSEGAAWASLIAEFTGCMVGLTLVHRLAFRARSGQNDTKVGPFDRHWLFHQLRKWSAYRELFSVNRHLLVRTSCLIFVFAFFTAQGAQHGAEILAANAILMQLFFLFSFGLDGFAQAAEALTGQAIGSDSETRFYTICKLAAGWGFFVATAATMLYLLFDNAIIALFTDIPGIVQSVKSYFFWLAMMPLTAVGSFLLDGIFLGAGKTRGMQNIMLASTILVFVPIWLATSTLGNDGLWFAFLMFMASRTALMSIAFWQISRQGWCHKKQL